MIIREKDEVTQAMLVIAEDLKKNHAMSLLGRCSCKRFSSRSVDAITAHMLEAAAEAVVARDWSIVTNA